MKVMILAVAGLCLAVVGQCLAETPAGWPVLKISSGKEFREVKVTAVEPDGIKITHADGVARVPYEQLPAEVRSAFTFDPAKAVAVREKREADIRLAAQKAAAKRKWEQALKDAEKVKLELKGEVLQVVRDGLLLTDAIESMDGRHWGRVSGSIVMLQGSFKDMVDGQAIYVDAYPAGVTSYKDVRGAVRTVRLYCMSPEAYLALTGGRSDE